MPLSCRYKTALSLPGVTGNLTHSLIRCFLTDGLDGTMALFPYIGRPNIPPSGPNP
jgi:hypothetical protein